jgi:hypothetical protein
MYVPIRMYVYTYAPRAVLCTLHMLVASIPTRVRMYVHMHALFIAWAEYYEYSTVLSMNLATSGSGELNDPQ